MNAIYEADINRIDFSNKKFHGLRPIYQINGTRQGAKGRWIE